MVVADSALVEAIKSASNGFVATKISVVNALAAICEAAGADVADVVEGSGLLASSAGSSCIFARRGMGVVTRGI